MKEILVDLNKSVNGIIGSFVIDEDGRISAKDVPELMAEQIDKISKTLHLFTRIIKTTRSVDKLYIESENAKLISIEADARILVVIAERKMSQSLFNIMSYLAVTEIKDIPPLMPPFHKTEEEEIALIEKPETRIVYDQVEKKVLNGAHAKFTLVDRHGKVIDTKKSTPLNDVNPGDVIEFYMIERLEKKINLARYKVKETPDFDHNKICDLYDQLFGVAAKRVSNLIGPKSGSRFKERAESVIKTYPYMFDGLIFDKNGIPDKAGIRAQASKMSHKEELIEALDEMLLSMFETVKIIAGKRQVQKAREELDHMLDAMKKTEEEKHEIKALDSLQKIKIERAGIL